MKQLYRTVVISLAWCGVSLPALAQEESQSRILDMLPSESALRAYERAMQDNPNNLDQYFSYAEMAVKLGLWDRAVWAYEHMLAVNPELDRVKLDLGLAYSRMGRYEDAKKLLLEVRGKDIPPPVRKNIDFVIQQIDVASQVHFFSGSISMGANFDSNGNSSSSSGRITVFDTSIPLSDDQQAKRDSQFFSTASITHRYQPRDELMEGVRYSWETMGNIYGNEQNHLDELNLRIISAQTGPTLYFPELDTRLSLTQSATKVWLDQEEYLNAYATKLSAQYQWTPQLMVNTALTREYREFIDSPTVSTYDDRTGHAQQFEAGFGYAFGPKDYVDGSIALRHEDTKQKYYDNDQIIPSLGYTHQFEQGYFFRADAQYNQTKYNGPDNFISNLPRKDQEKTGTVTVGKQITDNVIFTIGAQHKDVNSTIENYDYKNTRYSTTLSVRF